MSIQTVGVVGMGQMGSGITEVFARAGVNVIAREINDELLARGLNYLKRSFGKGVERGKLSQADADAALSRITTTTQLTDFAGCDLVIEAATENMPLKKTIFTELDVICKPEAILASNTSSLSITEIASATQRPDRVVGLALLQPGAGHAVDRNRARPVDERRNAGRGANAGRAAQQAAGLRQRQSRLHRESAAGAVSVRCDPRAGKRRRHERRHRHRASSWASTIRWVRLRSPTSWGWTRACSSAMRCITNSKTRATRRRPCCGGW